MGSRFKLYWKSSKRVNVIKYLWIWKIQDTLQQKHNITLKICFWVIYFVRGFGLKNTKDLKIENFIRNSVFMKLKMEWYSTPKHTVHTNKCFRQCLDVLGLIIKETKLFPTRILRILWPLIFRFMKRIKNHILNFILNI